MIDYIKSHLAGLLLLIFIPFATIGINFFESTPLYQYLIGVQGVNYTIESKLLGATGTDQYILPSSDPDFKNVWKLIQEYTSVPLPKDKTPQFISILATYNDPYTNFPQNGTTTKVILFPETIPIAVMFCSPSVPPGCVGNNVVFVGSVEDLKSWLSQKEDNAKTDTDSILAAISMILGIIMLLLKED